MAPSFEFTREELVHALDGFGVSVPPDCKMPTSALSKRLKQTLWQFQLSERYLSQGSPLDVESLPLWSDLSRVWKGMIRSNNKEHQQRQQARSEGRPFALPRVTLQDDLRHVNGGIASGIGQNCMYFDIGHGRGDICHCGINLRVQYLNTGRRFPRLPLHKSPRSSKCASYPRGRRSCSRYINS